MRKRRRLLLVSRNQFGYHTGMHKFAVGSRSHFDVSYLCWDYAKPLVVDGQISVIYVSRRGTKISRYLRFLKCAIAEARNGSFDIIFFTYFPGASLVKLFGQNRNWNFDIRTGPISTSRLRREFRRALLILEARFFENISVISSSLSQSLNLTDRNPHILPLGADIISASNKDWSEFRLLYVGTLELRNIHLTVRGLSRYIKAHPLHRIRGYTIIGTGAYQEEEFLRRLVNELDLADLVEIVGQLPHNKLAPYFDSHNVGISFVPITPYFDHQPPTKIYEYMLSGLAVLATNTSEIQKMVKNTPAILSDDSAGGFSDALEKLHKQSERLDSEFLRNSALDNTWTNIVNHNLIPYIDSLL